MELMAQIFVHTLNAARILVGAAFLVGVIVAITHWLVREQKIAAFGGWARFVRGWSDPLLRPIERKLPDGATERKVRRGISAQTFNFYLQAAKQFCRWMVRDGRASVLSASPRSLKSLPKTRAASPVALPV